MKELEDILSSSNCTSSTIISIASNLGPKPFVGLFLISGCVSTIAFLVTCLRLAERYLHIFSIACQALTISGTWTVAYLNCCCVHVAYQLTRTKSSILEIDNQRATIGEVEQTSIHVEMEDSSYIQR